MTTPTPVIQERINALRESPDNKDELALRTLIDRALTARERRWFGKPELWRKR